MRLIEQLRWWASECDRTNFGCQARKLLIEAAEALEKAEPVRHGAWIDHMVRDWRCSECGEKINKVRKVDGYCYDDKPKYCPNCGAKMDKENDDG